MQSQSTVCLEIPSTVTTVVSENAPTTIQKEPHNGVWRPHRAEWMVVISIFLLYIMIALDSTIIVPVLPVGFHMIKTILTIVKTILISIYRTDISKRAEGKCDPDFLGWHILSFNTCCLPAVSRRSF